MHLGLGKVLLWFPKIITILPLFYEQSIKDEMPFPLQPWRERRLLTRFQPVMMDSQGFLSTLKFIEWGTRSYYNQWTVPWRSYFGTDANLGRRVSYINNVTNFIEFLKYSEVIISLFAKLSLANLLPGQFVSF